MARDQVLNDWRIRALHFFDSLRSTNSRGYRSTPYSQESTLYGTCYTLLGKYYIGSDFQPSASTVEFLIGCQDPNTGFLIGPELANYQPESGVLHDRDHLALHSTCTALPVCRQFGIQLSHPIWGARKFCDIEWLEQWLDARDLKKAWFEGNNILFAGQLLVYLRDVEGEPTAARALNAWFSWLDRNVDPATSVWGTDGKCSEAEAVYGGYHQLLVYYHESHRLRNSRGLVDTILLLQHPDGSFHPKGNGGACEDVDCVDILVNLYKREDYRRAEIRCSLRRCMRHILRLQNLDGGFPYNRNKPQTHMGIPGTNAGPNESTAFATWFRVHTLALISEILTDEPALDGPFRFTDNLSMGWHTQWNRAEHQVSLQCRREETRYERIWIGRSMTMFPVDLLRVLKRLIRKGGAGSAG